MIRGLARMLAVAALVPLAAPARAAAQRSFTTTGSITYTWQGDPARACAAEGLCGVQGALILRSVQGTSSTSGGGPGGGIHIPFDTSGSTVRVSDGPGAGDCVDTPGTPGGSELLIVRRAGRSSALLQPSLSSGHCAGPRQQDLAGLALPVRRSRGRYPVYDLRTSLSFAAGPFTGRVVSTVVVRSVPNSPGSGSVTSGQGPGTPPGRHKVFLEQATLHYRLASLPGSFEVAFSGEGDPFCVTFDSCGASGTLSLAMAGARGSLVVQAFRRVSRRVDARQVLADLRRGRLHIAGGSVGQAGAGGGTAITETFAGSGGRRCQSTSESKAHAQLLVQSGAARGSVDVSLALGDQFGSDVLRTYCPGPSATDVFGSFPGAARASIGVEQLLARHSAITVTAPGSFAGIGYDGSRTGGLGFSLTLERVRAATTEVTLP